MIHSDLNNHALRVEYVLTLFGSQFGDRNLHRRRLLSLPWEYRNWQQTLLREESTHQGTRGPERAGEEGK